MVDLAKYFTNFLKDESCGQCFSCRKGTQRMYEILNDISQGVGTAEQLTLLEELAQVVKDTGMCGLGQTAPNPVLSTLRYFRDEYLEHIENHRCPAGVCRELITFAINENCRGCQQCIEVCPADAITGQKREPHAVDPNECVRCGACKTACNFDAVQVS
jgi:ferredoxin